MRNIGRCTLVMRHGVVHARRISRMFGAREVASQHGEVGRGEHCEQRDDTSEHWRILLALPRTRKSEHVTVISAFSMSRVVTGPFNATVDSDVVRAHERDLAALGERFERRGIAIEHEIEAVRGFAVAVPSWALGTGGTRFGRFPGPGEPRRLLEKLEDAAVVHRLTGAAPRVSLHIPWDVPDDPEGFRQAAGELGIGFDAVNSNTFQDQPGQALSYKLGSFSHTDPAVRRQAVEHNLFAIEIGKQLGSNAITIWLADGSNYPGQISLRKSFDRVLACLQDVYSALPNGWRLFTEHKPYEPAFYATVVQDWGSSYLLASALGERAQCLVDLGHHLPNTNVELVVARLLGVGKLGDSISTTQNTATTTSRQAR